MKNSLCEKRPEIAAEWHHEKNKIHVSQVSCGSHKKVWWQCPNGHEYQARIDQRTVSGSGCPICRSNRKTDPVSVTHPHLVSEWHASNDVSPEKITAGCHINVKWLGRCGHEWIAPLHNRTKLRKPSGCPYCCNRKVNESNSLSLFPELVAEWHGSKNGDLLPSDVNHRTYKRVWWVGKCGHEWEAMVRTRTRKLRPSGCPICQDSRGESEIKRVLEAAGLSYKSQVRFDDCRDKKPLPFDFLVGEKTLIEFQGVQHYEPVNFGGDYMGAFRGIQHRDRIKAEWCRYNNYKLVLIPYWDLSNIADILKREVIHSP